jgi:Insulinase (Peptidase family M16)/Peptidase M16 inactive domain
MSFSSTIWRYLRGLFLCALLLSLKAQAVCAWQQPVELKNGLQLLVCRGRVRGIVAIDFWVKAGSASELPGEYGAAHYLEHTLFKGTLHKSGVAADYAVELAGGQLNAATGADYAHYYTEVPAEGFDAALSTIAEIIRNPTFPEKEVARERDVILDELSKRSADQAERLTDRLYERAFTGGPYGRSPGGTPQTIKSRGRDTLAAYCSREYIPQNCILSVAGDVSAERVMAAARRCFEDWLPGTAAEKPKSVAPGQAAPSAQIQAKPGEMPGVAIAFFAPKASDTQNVCCALAAAALLGARFSSAKWSGTHVSVNYVPRRDVSLFVITAQVPRPVPPRPFETPVPPAFTNQQELIAAIEKDVFTLSETSISSPEMRAACSVVQGEYAFDMETCAGLARSIGRAATIGQAAPDQMVEALGRITSAQFLQFSRQWLVKTQEHRAYTASEETN